jgi:hypothetical protein
MDAVLFSEMVPDAGWEDEFNVWYDTEHIPVRMAVAGFTGAQRYKHTSDPGYLAVYGMSSVDVLNSAAYKQVKDHPSDLTARMLSQVTGFTRYIGSRISLQENPALEGDPLKAPVLYAVFFNVPDEAHEEFDAWYTQDHVPLLLGCKDWLAVHRYKLVDAHPVEFSHLAIHYLADTKALEAPERAAARATPWRDRLAVEPWFKGSYNVFNRLGARFIPTHHHK